VKNKKMSSNRLKESERKKIIEDYKKGIKSTLYDVYESPKQKGRYTIKRKTELQPEQDIVEEQQQQPEPELQQPEQQEDNPFLNDNMYIPPVKMGKNVMFREMQMMMNGMFLEQFKLLRKEQKHSDKERKRIGEQTYQMYKLLKKINEEPDNNNNNNVEKNKVIEEKKKNNVVIEEQKQQPEIIEEEDIIEEQQQQQQEQIIPKTKFNVFL
jgi:hypothetical protein